MTKRISARGIIIEDEKVYVIFRRKINAGIKNEYYVIPGGGINENETLEEVVKRELKEELSIDVTIDDYLGYDESEDTIAHFFSCSIKEGNPKLGGEELARCTQDNYYEIKQIAISDLDKIDIIGKDMIIRTNKKLKN